MAEIYPHIKHAHWLFILTSMTLFNVRFWWRNGQPDAVLPRPLRVMPHVNDTLLLFTGMMMMTIAKWPLFGAGAWLGVKLLCVMTYIVLGMKCLHSPVRSRQFYVLYAICMATVALIAWLAHCKLSTACHFFANWV